MQRVASWANALSGMETTLIFGALGALLFCGLMVVTLLMRGRRPELRMGREDDLIDEAEGEETLMRSLVPPPQPHRP